MFIFQSKLNNAENTKANLELKFVISVSSKTTVCSIVFAFSMNLCCKKYLSDVIIFKFQFQLKSNANFVDFFKFILQNSLNTVQCLVETQKYEKCSIS